MSGAQNVDVLKYLLIHKKGIKAKISRFTLFNIVDNMKKSDHVCIEIERLSLQEKWQHLSLVHTPSRTTSVFVYCGDELDGWINKACDWDTDDRWSFPISWRQNNDD